MGVTIFSHPAILSYFFPSRIQSNEANAVAALRLYHAAQMRLRSQKPDKDFSFLNDYSKFYYNLSDMKFTELISKEFADAHTFASGIPYNGYVFEEDGNLIDDDWEHGFALIADPFSYGETGRHTYWIGTEGIVYYCLNTGTQFCRVRDSIQTPLLPPRSKKNLYIWEKY